MHILRLAWKNVFNKPADLLLSILLFSLGIGLITFLMLLNDQLKSKFESNLADVSLVLGAKGSPLQLILCNMYHIDNPTGNIKIKDAKPFLNPKHPLIKLAVPLSLGDNYRQFRIIGTNDNILKLYQAKVEKGSFFNADYEVTLGKQVADEAGLTIGSTFVSSHGFVEDENLAHDHQKFKVVGILAPTGSVIDQLILCSTSSIWKVHQHEEAPTAPDEEPHNHEAEQHEHDSHDHAAEKHDHDADNAHRHEEQHAQVDTTTQTQNAPASSANSNEALMQHEDEEITSVLIQYRSKTNYQALNMPRNINENTAMQAAAPSYEISKLYNMIGIGASTIEWIAYLIALVSVISIFITLYKSMKERKYELALLRVLGSKRVALFLLIIFEGFIITVIGWFIGMLLGHIGMEVLAKYLKSDFKYSFSGYQFLAAERWLFFLSIGLGLLASLIPAIGAAKTDINKTLAQSKG